MTINPSDFVKKCLLTAEKKSKEHENGFVGTEHFLWAILHEKGSIYDVLREMAIDTEAIMSKLETFMDDYKGLSLESAAKTPRIISILENAEKNAQSSNSISISEKDIWHALVNAGPGCAMRTLSEQTCAFEEIEHQIKNEGQDFQKTYDSDVKPARVHTISNPVPIAVQFMQQGFPFAQPQISSPVATEKQSGISGTQFFDRDLSALGAAKKTALPYGRDNELREISQTLVKTKANCPVIIGERGTGRTSLAEGIAIYLKTDGPASIKHTRVLEISRNKIMQILGDTKKDADNRFKNFLKTSAFPGHILVFDSVMEIYDEERVTWNMLSMVNEIKKLVDEQIIRAIFITTPADFEKIYAKDPVLSGNCEKIILKELNQQDTREVLKKESKRLAAHHRISIENDILDSAAELAYEFIKEGYFPAKAIDLIDESCAIALMEKKSSLSLADLEKAVSKRSGLPIEKIAKKGVSLKSIEAALKSQIIGQDEAIEKVCDRIRLFMAGLNNENRPLGVFFFAGPTGVGKTELARVLAKEVFGGEENFHRFDMSEYSQSHEIARLIGAPPGYVGYNEEGQLTGAVRKNPHSLILLDEFEKSHERIFNIFLQVFDAGRLTDGKGELVDFRNTLIIMTSNLGASIAANNYNAESRLSVNEIKDALVTILRQRFSMEFINRIDELILFNTLSVENIRNICSMVIDEWAAKIQKNKNRLEIDQQVINHLCDKSYDPQFGVRNMRRIIENALIIPISRKLVDEEVQDGAVIRAFIENDAINIKIEKQLPAAKNSITEIGITQI